jgi:hypothetical protein
LANVLSVLLFWPLCCLYFSFSRWCCLYFFDLHILITPLVSSNSSYRNDKVLVLLYIYYEKKDWWSTTPPKRTITSQLTQLTPKGPGLGQTQNMAGLNKITNLHRFTFTQKDHTLSQK